MNKFYSLRGIYRDLQFVDTTNPYASFARPIDIYNFIKNYGYRRILEHIPNDLPIFDCFSLSGAKPNDIMSAPIGLQRGLIISKKMYGSLCDFNIAPSVPIDFSFIYKGVRQDNYIYLFFYSQMLPSIDFSKSLFFKLGEDPNNPNLIEFSSFEELCAYEQKNLCVLTNKKIHLTSEIRQYDIFGLFRTGQSIIVNEKTKSILEKQKLSGLQFKSLHFDIT